MSDWRYKMNAPIHVTDADFQEKVLGSKIPVVVDFWAPWCAPCKMIAPMLEQIANQHENELVIAKVNTDEDPEWAIHYGVQGIPTLLFVVDGDVKDVQVGVAPLTVLKGKVDSLLKSKHVLLKS
jgi:thioredoxin 1